MASSRTRDELVNELTGETLTLANYVDQVRSIERQIFRLDNTIADLKSSVKAAREDRDKAVSALRSAAREIKLLTRGGKAPGPRGRLRVVQTSAPEGKKP